VTKFDFGEAEAAPAGVLAPGDDLDELVETPANPAQNGTKMIKAMIAAQPISPFRQKCPFFLIS
jgi:hypothetical protein